MHVHEAPAIAGKRQRDRPGQAAVSMVGAGQRLRITDLDGKQMASCVALNWADPAEAPSVAATRTSGASLLPRLGMVFPSNRRTPMFELVGDAVGRHDMLITACDPRRYEEVGEPAHANCREALAAALAPYGIADDRLPDPVNWFMHVAFDEGGALKIREPLSRAGDAVVLRARMDLLVAVAACPHDKNPTNGFAPSDVGLDVFD